MIFILVKKKNRPLRPECYWDLTFHNVKLKVEPMTRVVSTSDESPCDLLPGDMKSLCGLGGTSATMV